MSHLPFHQEQLEFMVGLTGNRIEFLDPLFRFLAYFDTPYFFFVLIPVIWLGFSYKWGLRIFYWFTFNNLLINLAKNAVGWPRPSTDLPEIGFFHPTSYGFPSGGAEVAFFLGGILIYYWRTPAAWFIGTIYILLLSFTRLYIGVHYPIDILGGWALAAIVLTLFIITKEPLENWLAKKGPTLTLPLSLGLPLALILAFPVPSIYYPMGSAIGVGIGTYFSLKHHLFLRKPANLNEGIGRSFIGIAMIFMIVMLIPGEQSFFKSWIAGLFMSVAASPICRWFVEKKVK